MFFPPKAVGNQNTSEARRNFCFPLALDLLKWENLPWNLVLVVFLATMSILVKPGLQSKSIPTEEGTVKLC